MISDGTVQLRRSGVGYGCDGQLRQLVNGIAYSAVSLKLFSCGIETDHTELWVCHGQRNLLFILDGV